MKLFKRFLTVLALTAVIALLFTVNTLAAENLLDNVSSLNLGMFAVPAPGPVEVDGSFDEWDWSGRIEIFPNYDTKLEYNAECAVMYDKDYIYMGFICTEPTPLNNAVDPYADPAVTWRGDCFQLRLKGDHEVFMTIAYHKNYDRYSAYVVDFPETYDSWAPDYAAFQQYTYMYMSEPGGTDLVNYTNYSYNDRIRPYLCNNMQMCAKMDPYDPLKYYIEFKMPIEAMYYGKPATLTGQQAGLTFEWYWCNETGYARVNLGYKDNYIKKDVDRALTYQHPEVWGTLSFSDSNNIEMRQYSKTVEDPMSGPLEAYIKIPSDRELMTVIVEDEKGNRVRNLVSELEVEKYVVADDGINKTVKIRWDGTDDYGKHCGYGKYIYKAIAYNKIKPVFDYAFGSPGQIPWSNSNTASAWTPDHSSARAIATYGDMVYISAGWSESVVTAMIGVNTNDFKKYWGTLSVGGRFVCANEKYLYILVTGSDYSSNWMIKRYDRESSLTEGTSPAVVAYDVNGSLLSEIDVFQMIEVNNGYRPTIVGMDSNDKYIALAHKNDDKKVQYKNYRPCITFLDVETMKPVKRIFVDDIGEIRFTKDGKKLYGLSNGNVIEIDIEKGEVIELPIKSDEDNGIKYTLLTVDNDNNIVLFDGGDDLQVKAFTPKGAPVYTVGKEGGRTPSGWWDETGFGTLTRSICVDNNDHIWVVEETESPRRISVWSQDNKLVKDYLSTTGYKAAFSNIDHDRPNVGYVFGVEYKVDPETGEYECVRICFDTDKEKGHFVSGVPGDFNSTVKFFTYEVDGKELHYAFNGTSLFLEDVESGVYLPIFHSGTGNPIYTYEPYREIFKGHENDRWIWQDFNLNGVIDEEEITFYPVGGTSLTAYANIWFDRDNDGIMDYNEVLTQATAMATKAANSDPQAIMVEDENGELIFTKPNVYYIDPVYNLGYNNDTVKAIETYKTETGDLLSYSSKIHGNRVYDPTNDEVSSTYETFTTSYSPVKTVGTLSTGFPIRHGVAGLNTWMNTEDFTMMFFDSKGFETVHALDFNEKGVPIFDFANPECYREYLFQPTLSTASAVYPIIGGDTAIVMPGRDTRYELNGTHANSIRGIDLKTGEEKWSYRSYYASIDGGQAAPLKIGNGFITGAFKPLGSFENAEGTKFFAISGYQGTVFILTEDGYFVNTVFQDSRISQKYLPNNYADAIGMDLSTFSNVQEPFGGFVTTQNDGKTRIVTCIGISSVVVAELQNLDTIKYVDPLEVIFTKEQMEEAYAWIEPVIEEVPEEEDAAYGINYKEGITVDCSPNDWGNTNTVRISDPTGTITESGSIRVAYDNNNLYVYAEVADASPFMNSTEDYIKLFKGGDAIDLFISPSGNNSSPAVDGDMRILIGKVNGQNAVTVTKEKDSTSDGKYSFVYKTEAALTPVDTVKLVNGAVVMVETYDGGYTLEASIPLAELGLKVPENADIFGDLGFIFSDEAGKGNRARMYYYNNNSEVGLNSDIPSEARLYTNHWGKIKFNKQ